MGASACSPGQGWSNLDRSDGRGALSPGDLFLQFDEGHPGSCVADVVTVRTERGASHRPSLSVRPVGRVP